MQSKELDKYIIIQRISKKNILQSWTFWKPLIPILLFILAKYAIGVTSPDCVPIVAAYYSKEVGFFLEK